MLNVFPDFSPNVLIAFEDLESGRQAAHVIERAFAQAIPAGDFQPVLWSFDRLDRAESRSDARLDASRADILLIASRARVPFSPALVQWIVEWIDEKRGGGAALLAHIQCSTNPDPACVTAIEQLRASAEQAGIDFFSSEVETAAVWDPDPLPPGATSIPSSMPPRFWGLNE